MSAVISPKKIRDSEFARRLDEACDLHPPVPRKNYGRQTWVRDQLKERFDEVVSAETVRKWFAGETRPRPNKMKLLADLLEADEAWLSLAIQPELTRRERRARNAAADGAVNLLAGVIQMGGGTPAFPDDDDKRAEKAHIDLYAIIKGAQYAFHVSLAQSEENKRWKFVVPSNWGEAFQMGIVQDGLTSFRFVELDSETIEGAGTGKGGFVEVIVNDDEISRRKIENFSQRL